MSMIPMKQRAMAMAMNPKYVICISYELVH
jgi:hypothetical protein